VKKQKKTRGFKTSGWKSFAFRDPQKLTPHRAVQVSLKKWVWFRNLCRDEDSLGGSQSSINQMDKTFAFSNLSNLPAFSNDIESAAGSCFSRSLLARQRIESACFFSVLWLVFAVPIHAPLYPSRLTTLWCHRNRRHASKPTWSNIRSTRKTNDAHRECQISGKSKIQPKTLPHKVGICWYLNHGVMGWSTHSHNTGNLDSVAENQDLQSRGSERYSRRKRHFLVWLNHFSSTSGRQCYLRG